MTDLELPPQDYKLKTIEFANIKNSNRIIKTNDKVNVEIENRLTSGTVERIYPASVEFLINVRFNKNLYTLINTKYIEYRNYGTKGFYRVGCKDYSCTTP